MVGTKAKRNRKFEVHTLLEKCSFRDSTIFSSPIFDKLQNVFSAHVRGVLLPRNLANFENLVSVYIVRKCSLMVFTNYRISTQWFLLYQVYLHSATPPPSFESLESVKMYTKNVL